jgi:hypothetical protein
MTELKGPVDRSRSPSSISFAPGFNVAVPFIDRHVAEGPRREGRHPLSEAAR